jgi:micrococcal nuclease
MWTYQANVLKVIDGDTIDVSIDLGFSIHFKTRMRMLGVDTAEKITAFGKVTKSILVTAIEGKMVKVEVSKPDKYGRYLCRVWLNSNESVNDQMIRKGLAKSYMGDSKMGLWTEQELAQTSSSVVIE